MLEKFRTNVLKLVIGDKSNLKWRLFSDILNSLKSTALDSSLFKLAIVPRIAD